MTRAEQRTQEITEIRERIATMAREIDLLVGEFPDEAHLGTWRALNNVCHTALMQTRSYIERENARRVARLEESR